MKTETRILRMEAMIGLWDNILDLIAENRKLKKELEQMNNPTTFVADVAQVRHGRWIEQEKYTFGTMYDCSICGDRILDNGHEWNYCPNCGAKMDGDIK